MIATRCFRCTLRARLNQPQRRSIHIGLLLVRLSLKHHMAHRCRTAIQEESISTVRARKGPYHAQDKCSSRRRVPLRPGADHGEFAAVPHHGLPLHELSAHDWQRFLFKYGNPEQRVSITRGEPVIGGLHGANPPFFLPALHERMFTRPEGLISSTFARPCWMMRAVSYLSSKRTRARSYRGRPRQRLTAFEKFPAS